MTMSGNDSDNEIYNNNNNNNHINNNNIFVINKTYVVDIAI